jgi:hypothetical protein
MVFGGTIWNWMIWGCRDRWDLVELGSR